MAYIAYNSTSSTQSTESTPHRTFPQLPFPALPNHLAIPLLSTPSLPQNPLLFHPCLAALGLQNLPTLRCRSPLIAPCLQNWHFSLLVHEDHDHDAEGLHIIHCFSCMSTICNYTLFWPNWRCYPENYIQKGRQPAYTATDAP